MTDSMKAIIQDVLAKVDQFIYDLENGNIEFSDKAQDMTIYVTEKGRLGQTSKKSRGTYLSELGKALSDYKTSTFLPFRWDYAQECLRLIEWAYAHGVVLSKGLEKKLKSLEEENKRLKELTATAIARTEDTHQLLFSLENRLREFVSIKTKEANGRIDKSIIRNWESSMKKEALPPRKPKPYDLIYYSTFDQLRMIIVQNENWERIFRKYFGRPNGVISRINELDEIRDTIAHNRTLSDFDYGCFKTLYDQILGCIETKNGNKNTTK